GAGAAGSSAAYHLSQFAAAAGIPLNITVFERESHVGGRSTTVNAWGAPGVPVELGASIFVEVNKILVDAVKEFGLSTGDDDGTYASAGAGDDDDAPDTLGIWNGHEFVFSGPSDLSWWDRAKLLWKYGLAPIKTMRLMRATVGRFLEMYQEPYFPFRSLSEAAAQVGLLNATAATGEEFLRQGGIGESFAREVVQASTRVNYAQNLPLIDGLTTMVCMAAQGAMSVAGGNWRIFSSMLSAAKANVRINTTVTTLARHPEGGYMLLSNAAFADKDAAVTLNPPTHFDTVILAAPHQFANITITSPSSSPNIHIPDTIPYVTLHVTLLASPRRLNPAFFSLPPSSHVPDTILTTLAPDETPDGKRQFVGRAGFFSISTLRRARNPETGRTEWLYKIFSPEAIDEAFLGAMLGIDGEFPIGGASDEITWLYRKVWQSYPYELPRVTFEKLGRRGLEGSLWYTSGIESFISTMETSALMGRNVARLVVDGWVGEKEKGLGNGRDHAAGGEGEAKEL
ncbi:prenylcysteine oxidase-like protein 1 precursor, partial [Saccharata proteae CBS 121410]